MSNEKTELLSCVRDLIKEQDDLEKALPLDEPKFGRWPGKKKRSKQEPEMVSLEEAEEQVG